jgi:hypothetical protein
LDDDRSTATNLDIANFDADGFVELNVRHSFFSFAWVPTPTRYTSRFQRSAYLATTIRLVNQMRAISASS